MKPAASKIGGTGRRVFASRKQRLSKIVTKEKEKNIKMEKEKEKEAERLMAALQRLRKNIRRAEAESDTSSDSCPRCGGTGHIVWQGANGERFSKPCTCAIIAETQRQIAKSGLSDLFDKSTFERFKVCEAWQAKLKSAAQIFASATTDGRFFIGGASGCGKTHLCTAACGLLLKRGMRMKYFQWRADAPRLKSLVNDAEAYQRKMEPLKKVKVLYIDDFFKGSVTSGDINLAVELLNSRYISPDKITIISSELTIEQILKYDAAIGGRIAERAGEYIFTVEDKPNWRLFGAEN